MSGKAFAISSDRRLGGHGRERAHGEFAYLNKCVDARMGFFKQNGFPVTEFAKRRIGPVVRRDELEYFREVAPARADHGDARARRASPRTDRASAW